MIPPSPSMRIYLACGATDMRKGFNGLAVMAQEVLRKNPHSGALFDPVNKMPENSTIIDFPGWGYEPETGKYSSKHVIRFDRNDIVVSVSCFAECDDFLGLRLGMTEDDAINLLGRPEMIEYQSTSKWLRYHRYGADIILTKGIISGFEKTKSANVSIQNYAALIWKNLLANGQP